jgi:hypothetical protein
MTPRKTAAVSTGTEIDPRNLAASAADSLSTEQSKLSGEGIELPQDTGTPALTCRDDTPLASVGEIHGAADDRRQGSVIAERMEGRPKTLAAGAVEGSQRAEAIAKPLTSSERRGELR